MKKFSPAVKLEQTWEFGLSCEQTHEKDFTD